MTTLVHTADVLTDAPARYAKQLAAHLGRKLVVTQTEAGPRLTMTNEHGEATCLLDSRRGDILRLEVRGEEPAVVERMTSVVGSHLERFGERSGLVVEWRAG